MGAIWRHINEGHMDFKPVDPAESYAELDEDARRIVDAALKQSGVSADPDVTDTTGTARPLTTRDWARAAIAAFDGEQ